MMAANENSINNNEGHRSLRSRPIVIMKQCQALQKQLEQITAKKNALDMHLEACSKHMVELNGVIQFWQ